MFVAVTRVACIAALIGAPAALRAWPTQDPPTSVPSAVDTTNPTQFAGLWEYNAAESVNAANGRPERAPRSATQRAGAPASTGRGGGGGQPRGGGLPSGAGEFAAGSGGGGGSRRNGDGMSVGPTPEMMRETRDLSRDLLEIAETLTIQVTPEDVSFTDDLERERTYPTSGVKRKYQLGAARFDAIARWEGARLQKRIEGPYGFRMTETYFLSADARRLFVIVRIGEPKKDQPVVGVNRVYDRVE